MKSAVFLYRRALLRNNKRYAFAFLIVFVFLIGLFALLFFLRGAKNLDVSPEDLKLALSSYENKLAEFDSRLEKGELNEEIYWRISAPFRFYLERGKCEAQYIDLNTSVLGAEFSSVSFFLMRAVLPFFSLTFGVICGVFFFSSDFASGRIKNVFCLSASRDHQFWLFLKTSLAFAIGLPIYIWVFLFALSVPICSLQITHWWNTNFYSQSVLSCCFSVLLAATSLSFFGFFLSSSLGILWRNLLSSALLPCLLSGALLFLSFYINSEAPNGFKEIYPSLVPMGGFLFGCLYGQTPAFWFHFGLLLLSDLILFFLLRRLYGTVDL